jgi:hypothetical protein
MQNLLYESEEQGVCGYCGGRCYVSVVYLEQAATGWHLLIEEECHDCDRLDVMDIPMSRIEEIIDDLEQQDQDQ